MLDLRESKLGTNTTIKYHRVLEKGPLKKLHLNTISAIATNGDPQSLGDLS